MSTVSPNVFFGYIMTIGTIAFLIAVYIFNKECDVQGSKMKDES